MWLRLIPRPLLVLQVKLTVQNEGNVSSSISYISNRKDVQSAREMQKQLSQPNVPMSYRFCLSSG